MRFPLPLTADLGIALAARAFARHSGRSVVAPLDPAELCHRSDDLPKHDAPAVWIAGSEPLRQPDIAATTRKLLNAGRYVFLRTDGELWLRRVHEFQPVSRFFVTLNCNRAGHTRAKEAIRTARLSGFFTCVHTEISAGIELAELQTLQEYVRVLRVDGWVIAASAASGTLEYLTLQRTAAEARTFIPSRRWRIFSEFVEAAIHARTERAPQPGRSLAAASSADACEESAGAQ